jgi:16S rRNA (guanine1207-N2)-methyltransferase
VGIISHYFSKDNDLLASNRKTIRFVVHSHLYEMETDIGVFSKAGLDYGTRVLLENISLEPGLDVLDLGCGYGPIGIVAAKEFSSLVVMADINLRAVELAEDNAKQNNVQLTVVQSDGFANITGFFDAILMNPPIRTGKKVIYALFENAREHLKPEGRLILVINKNQGAESALSFLRTIYGKAEVLGKKSGYCVISSQK